MFKKNDSGIYQYQQVVDFEGKSATQLYDKIYEWIFTHYKSREQLIVLDIPGKTIIIEGYLIDKASHAKEAFGLTTVDKEYKVKYEFKDNKIRLTYSDIVLYMNAAKAKREPTPCQSRKNMRGYGQKKASWQCFKRRVQVLCIT